MYSRSFSIIKNVISGASCNVLSSSARKGKSNSIRFLVTSSSNSKQHAKWVAPTFREFKRRHERMVEKDTVPETRRSTFIEWNHEAELYAFGQRLGETFDEKLLLTAMIDQSHIAHLSKLQEEHGLDTLLNKDNKNKYKFTEEQPSNAALAKEGAHCITKHCSDFVRRSWPHVPEEGITAIVEYLSSDDIMSKVAQSIGLTDLLFAEPYPPSAEILSNGARAVIGALNQSSGEQRTEMFVIDFVASHMAGKSLWDMWNISEPMETLRSIMMRSSGGGEVEGRLINRAGDNTLEAVYRIGVYVNKKFIGAGYGETVEIASDLAALDALARMFGATNDKPCLPFKLSLPPSYSKFKPIHYKLPEWNPIKLSDYTIQDAANIVQC